MPSYENRPRVQQEPVHGLENGRFTNPPDVTSFRGEATPANFRYTVSGDTEPVEGQEIGYTTDGLVLRWLSGMVVSMTKRWRAK